LGNYWGDYSDLYPEASNDGTIWDTPYKINGTENTYDNYPLVQKLNDDNDITDPVWEKKPSDQTLDYGEPFSYQVNASDNVAIDEYWIEGSKDFQIDENGLITNATILSADIYEFTVVVNDTSGNENFATMKVAVLTPTEKGDGINNSEISIPGYTPSLLVIIGLIGATFAIRKFYLKRFN
ncbi:MAG: hypothetical protein ACOC44_17830, partial [Promethearchaeia archaeon]